MNHPPLQTRLLEAIRKQRLISPGATIILALSGGADSCALLDMLVRQKTFPLHIIVAHLNHCLRDAESDADELFARGLAERYSLPFESRRVDVRELARNGGLNLEDAGRRARLAFLEKVRQEYDAESIALAHHADDQAETLLMRLMRGSGLSGLSGMAWRCNHRIRPMLAITRHEILDYLKNMRLEYREDSSNQNCAFLRNRIRHELLPLLETYNPAISSNLAATAELLTGEDDLLSDLTEEKFSRLAARDKGWVSFQIKELLAQHPALQRRLIRRSVSELTGSLQQIAQIHINQTLELAGGSGPNSSIDLPGQLRVRREYDVIKIDGSNRHHTETDQPPTVIIDGPGCYPLWDGMVLEVSLLAPPDDILSTPRNCAWLDPAKAAFPWLARSFRPGDRIRPLGMQGSRKVKELFIDSKLPSWQRRRVPLLFSADNLLWAAGLRLSADAALLPGQATALFTKIKGLPPFDASAPARY